jgi:hypothetical protein
MLLARANASFDRFARPRMQLAGRSVSAFHVCGFTGLGAAIVLAMALVIRRGYSPLVMAAIVVSAMITFLALAMGQKIVTGRERLIYYQQEIGVMVVAAILLWILGQPSLLYLDATLLGIGAFLACGRVGCTMVGCCHGRPHRFGIAYRPEHALDGFTPYYVGIRLFPVQTVEALFVAFITLSGAWLVWRGDPPGAGLAWYVVLYDAGRFSFEFIRGDADRPYYLGFSQAQWLSAILLVLVVGAEWRGILPWRTWHAVVAAAMVAVMIVEPAVRAVRRSDRDRLLHPHHVREVAEALGELAAGGGKTIAVAETSRGVLISGGATVERLDRVTHFSFSARGSPLSEEAAETLAALVAQLNRLPQPADLVQGGHGVYHLVARGKSGP